jgi:hypothetical protein
VAEHVATTCIFPSQHITTHSSEGNSLRTPPYSTCIRINPMLIIAIIRTMRFRLVAGEVVRGMKSSQ